MFFLKVALAFGFALSLTPLINPAEAAPVTIQTEATASNAAAGESGTTIASSALIELLVTDAGGMPVSNLGTTVGTGTSAITLPSGWDLQTPAVPPGGCLLTPTQFSNSNSGRYSIRVVPFANNPACHWLSGDYIYSIQIGSPSQFGSALGKLTIR
jgi:hypothetical protein